MLPFIQPNAQNNSFIIKDLIYIPTGQYHPVMIRPYVAHLNGEAVDSISSRLLETNSGSITPAIVSGVANNIIKPSGNPFQSAVNSDWVTSPKYVFLLTVVELDVTGAEIVHYIYGYTSHDGITNSGAVDPTMRHYVNNVIETQCYNITTPTGVVRREKISRIYHVTHSGNIEYVYLQRPTDILERIKLNQISTTFSSGDDNWYSSSFDANSQLNRYNDKSAASFVDNNITTHYLSKVLDAGFRSQINSQVFVNDYHVREDDSSSLSPEPMVTDNRFLRSISRLEGFSGVVTSFGMGSLNTIDPTIVSRFKVFNITKDFIDPLLMQTPEVGDYWNGRDPVTSKAYELIESSVSMVLKYGFSKMYFTASNMTNPMGNPDIFISNFNSFVNLDDVSFNAILEIFKRSFITDVFQNEVALSGFNLHMEVFVDILGTSKIYLQYAGFPGNWYTIPTFANSLFSPVLSVDEGGINATASGLQRAIEVITSNVKPQMYNNLNF